MDKSTYNKIKGIYEHYLELPIHKILYMLNTDDNSMLIGCMGMITRYGFKLSPETFDIFYDVVFAKISGSYEVEAEFSEKEYKSLMSIKKYCLK